jgi:pilus assembly protein FimV
MYAQAAGAAGAGAVGAGVATGVATGVAAGAAAGVAAAALTHDAGPQTMLSQQLEQAFRNRGETPETIEPASTVDAVTGAPLDSGFDLDSLGLGDDATALPQLHDSAAAGAAQQDNALDFDLGDLGFQPVSAAEPAFDPRANETAVPDLQFDMAPFAPLDPASGTPLATGPATGGNLDDLAFDMNFGTPDSASAATPIEAVDEDDAFVLDLSKNGPNTDIDLARLAREFELPPLPDVPAAQSADQPARDLADPLFDLDAMDFGLADAAPASVPGARQEPVFDFGSTDLDLAAPMEAAQHPADAAQTGADKDPLFDLDMMDFGQSVRPASPTPGTPAPQFDMSGLDLDLPPPANGFDLAGEPARELNNAFTDEPTNAPAGGGAELTAAQMEMETKLDLAIAYQEIGDKEGARELLDEVIKGGNVEQSSRASAMRAQLA